MAEITKAYRHEWRGDLVVLYGRDDDGDEVSAIAVPPQMLPLIAASKPAAEQGAGWSVATPLPVNFFETGDMPMEGLVVLTVHPSLGPPLLFSCTPEQALQLAELLERSAASLAGGGHG